MDKLTASQVKLAYEYKNVKQKLLNTNQNIKFNKTCLNLNIIPNYAQIKIKNKSYAAKRTKILGEKIWIKTEIKFLYRKKSILNNLLYKKHLDLANIVHPTQRDQIFSKMDNLVNTAIIKKTKIQNRKIEELIKHKPNEPIKINHKFYPRIVNYSDIVFTEPETEVLNKGLKHNFPHKSWKKQLVSEILNVETAINIIRDDQTKTVLRHAIDNKVVSLQKSDKTRNKPNSNVSDALESIKRKLIDHECIVIKADKGQSTVIMNVHEYNSKVEEFIINNNIEPINKDPTNKFSKTLLNNLNKIKHLFTKDEIKRMKMIDPRAPTMRGQPKVHKEGTPMRPIVNFTSAPAYKVAKHLDRFLRDHIIINNNHSIKNSIELVNTINSSNINSQYTMASLDIVNLFTNVPVETTINLVRDNLSSNSNLTVDTINELVSMLEIVLKQNYFQFNNKYYIQQQGLTMGSPLSSFLSEIYLNHIENTHILSDNNHHAKNILLYKRYVDDTIVFYKGNIRQLELLNKQLNNITPNLQFTLETENDHKINFLDLTLKKDNNKISFSIYRKPTATDHTIHSSSYHPMAHKMAAYNSMVHRLLLVPMDNEDFENELLTIKYIAVANGYKSNTINDIVNKKRKKLEKEKEENVSTNEPIKQQYVSVEYGQSLHYKLTKELNKENVKVSCRTSNKLGKLLNVQKSITDINTGVYKLNCSDCPMFYIGQTGRSFKKRFSEHMPKPSLKTQISKFAEHLVTNNHTIDNRDNNMEILFKYKKSHFLTTMEELHIYNAFKNDPRNVLNEKLKYNCNVLFNRISEIERNRRHGVQGQQVGVG